MAEQVLKNAISSQKMKCPSCGKPVKEYDKYTELTASVWDGAGDSGLETAGSKVTLICGNCDWRERTEYWANYIDE
jgi:hypothetical protein